MENKVSICLFVYNWFYTGRTVYGHCLNSKGEYKLITVNGFEPSCYVEGETVPHSRAVPSRTVYKRMVTSRDVSNRRPFYQVFFRSLESLRSFESEVKSRVYMADVPQITVFLSQINADHVGWVRVPYYIVDHPSKIEAIKDKNPYINPKVMVFDIEVKSQDSGMPRAYRIDDTIEMISVVVYNNCDTSKIETYILHKCKSSLCIPDASEIMCRNEIELITRFFEVMKDEDPTIITGYNIYGFDIKYIMSRLQLRLTELPDVSRGLKRAIDVIKVDWSSAAYGHNKYERLVIGGRIILDMYLYFKRMKLDRYSLDHVSSVFIKENKHDMPNAKMMEAFRSGDEDVLTSVAKYCIQDSILVMKLFDKMQMWIDVCEVSKITMCEIESIYTRGEQMKMISQCVRECIYRNIVLQPQPSSEWKHYNGAYVLEPDKGVYNCCSLLDFQSLYPSIIIAYNVCSSTYMRQHNSNIDTSCCNKAGNHYFKKEPAGLLPGMVKKLIEERKAVKDKMKLIQGSLSPADTSLSYNAGCNHDEVTYTVLDRRQNALKVCANSVYGMMGFKKSKYFGHVECADSITTVGRNLLSSIVDEINSNYPVKVIYGDTDSCMLCSTDMSTEPVDMVHLSNLICENVTSRLPKPMALKLESYYDKVILLTKKRYILVNGDKVTYKGVMNARRDYCKFAKQVYKDIIDMVAAGKNIESIKKYIDNQLLLLLCGECEISDMIITKSIAKDLNSYVVNQPHVVMARRLERDTGVHVPAGTRLEYIFVKEYDNQAEKMRTPDEVAKNGFKVDGVYYIRKQLLTQIDDILSIIGLGTYIYDQWRCVYTPCVGNKL